MRLYRITHPDYAFPFDGEGARKYGGRWNPKGVPLLYYATSLALSALEKRAHVPAAALGRLWKVLIIEVPDTVLVRVADADLPADWSNQPAPESAKQFGRQWVESASSLGLLVPSTIIRREYNALLNPLHPDLGKAQQIAIEDFRFDARLAL